MELLIIKDGPDYIRIKEDAPLRVHIEKASVFPMSKIEKVREICEKLSSEGFSNICSKKLILTDEDL